MGADAIFACLGPALEIFSRYSRVERPAARWVQLREYLEHVWAAVSREALSMIFADAETAGLEEDARVTAMWLWTLAGPRGPNDREAADIKDDLRPRRRKRQPRQTNHRLDLSWNSTPPERSPRVSALSSNRLSMSSR